MRLIDAGLDGKSVLVTGAAGGVGGAVSAAFARHGLRVCLADVDSEGLTRVRSSLPNSETHVSLVINVGIPSEANRAVEDAHRLLGRLDILVHAAAVLRRRDIDMVTEEDWTAQIDANLTSTFFLGRAAGRLFRSQGNGGRIINFASDAWWTGGLNGAAVYAASKGGVVSLTRGFAREYAAHGITVNSIAPAMVDTPMLRAELSEVAFQEYAISVPLGRMADTSEVADTVVFLASDAAAYITGTTINISGGFLNY